MKSCVLLFLSLGILSVIGETISPETIEILSDTIAPHSDRIEDIYSEDVKPDVDQETIIVPNANNEVTDRQDIAEVVIQVEETMSDAPVNFLDTSDANIVIDEENQGQHFSASDEIVNKDPDEIMDTAAGFVPIPIIRNRRKQNKRVSTRRNFKRRPYLYRRFYYYPYSFYYPSSLRFY